MGAQISTDCNDPFAFGSVAMKTPSIKSQILMPMNEIDDADGSVDSIVVSPT